MKESAARTSRRDSAMLAVRSLTDRDAKKEAREALHFLAQQAQERVDSVEGRLQTLVSLAAVAAAVTFGIGVSGIDGKLGNSPSATTLAVAAVYAVVQLLCALRAAVNGLGRSSFLTLDSEDLIPRERESEGDREERLAELWLDVMFSIEVSGHRKVEQMAVAHCALKNFVYGVLVAAAAVLAGRFG